MLGDDRLRGAIQKNKPNRLLLIIAYLGFISLGLPDTVIGIAWPSVRDTFGLPQSAMSAVLLCGGMSYLLTSFFTGRLLGWLRIGVLLAASSALVAVSNFGFALAPVWLLFVPFAILHGAGSGAIDAGLNHYVAHHFSARHMNWLHACYSLGATFGPMIMTAVVVWYGAWRTGYFAVAMILLVLAVLFSVTRRKWDEPGSSEEEKVADETGSASLGETLRDRTVWLQVILFFFYTGLELTLGHWSFTILTEARRIPVETAGLWVTIYWGSIAGGRVLFGFIVERIGVDRLVRWSSLGVVMGVLLFGAFPEYAVAALALAGLGLAPIYPCLMTRTPQRVGKQIAAHAIGLQVSAAMLGGAALPSVSGFLAQQLGLEKIVGATLVMAIVVWLLHEGLLFRGRKQQGRTAANAAER